MKLKKTMNENDLIKELMNKYFINVGHDNYLELYEHLFDSVDGNHKGYSDILIKQQDYQNLTYSDIANKISNELTERC